MQQQKQKKIPVRRCVGCNAQRPKREEKPRVWQPKPAAPQGEMSFEDMMARYKTRSEEKIADLKRVTENHRGGYSRRRG